MTSKQPKLKLKSSHYIIVYADGEEGEYNCSLVARNGTDIQDLMLATVFNVADSINQDPITVCKALIKHLESILLPQSSGEIH